MSLPQKSRVVGYQGLLFGGRARIVAKRPGVRRCVLTCRLTPEEFEAVYALASKSGHSVSAFARQSLIKILSRHT